MVVGPVGCQSLGYPFAFPSWVTSPKWHLFFGAHICWVTFALWHLFFVALAIWVTHGRRHYFYLELHYNSGLHVSHGITYYLELHGPNGLHMSHGIDLFRIARRAWVTFRVWHCFIVLHWIDGLHIDGGIVLSCFASADWVTYWTWHCSISNCTHVVGYIAVMAFHCVCIAFLGYTSNAANAATSNRLQSRQSPSSTHQQPYSIALDCLMQSSSDAHEFDQQH